ncbi:MAG: threonine synthase [Candidatus Thermoplasmatota archaeon]|nr:threonine synthase [Candidatus Thermoplasmatota archaeon]
MGRPAYACSSCGNLLEVKMDIAESITRLSKVDHRSRPISVWRYRELLPLGRSAEVFSLGEGGTPLFRCSRLARELGLKNLHIKFEGANPTGSFKDRGMTVGISKAKELGMKIVTCASTGNTSASLAAYAGLAGMRCVVLIPEGKVAIGKLAQAMMHGAMVASVKGNFDQAFKVVMDSSERLGLYVLNSVNPFRIEGQKTAAYEICDQLEGKSPEYLYIPVGNGGNSAAYWKGFTEYEALGAVPNRPIIRGIQAEGSAPIARMFSTQSDEIVPVSKPETVATAIRIGNPANWKKTVRAIRESGGRATTVTDREILEAQKMMARFEGIFAEPAGSAALAGMIKDVNNGDLDKASEVVCVSTGHGLKDPDIAISQCVKPATIEASVDALRMFVGG